MTRGIQKAAVHIHLQHGNEAVCDPAYVPLLFGGANDKGCFFHAVPDHAVPEIVWQENEQGEAFAACMPAMRQLLDGVNDAG